MDDFGRQFTTAATDVHLPTGDPGRVKSQEGVTSPDAARELSVVETGDRAEAGMLMAVVLRYTNAEAAAHEGSDDIGGPATTPPLRTMVSDGEAADAVLLGDHFTRNAEGPNSEHDVTVACSSSVEDAEMMSLQLPAPWATMTFRSNRIVAANATVSTNTTLMRDCGHGSSTMQLG